ncbi:hypothetical protein GCM10018779_31720 [Streptomyces griseocarneus]|nr:hypothetical protein GCM10018779_31720 [Streptomyces griseocarneus]
MVKVENILARLVGRGPHVRVGLGALLVPGEGFVVWAAEGRAEVPELDAGEVLDEAEEVARRGANSLSGF